MLTFKQFIENIITENLHPELKSVVQSAAPSSRKHKDVIAKIKDLSARGEKTGIEGNMPKGSSRAYMKHEEEHPAIIDGKKTKFKIGTKISIRASLDKHHDAKAHDGMSLGDLQNQSENGDHFTNSQYRILKQKDDGSYKTNHDSVIFPPLVEHDHKNHQWSTVGHSRDIKAGEFKKFTKTDTHPKGISHSDFCSALERDHNRNNGRYWDRDKEHESHMEHVTDHPLVQKFLDHQHNYGTSPLDYRQRKNMGVFEHPDGSKHIVARDHGFSNEVHQAYLAARKRSVK